METPPVEHLVHELRTRWRGGDRQAAHDLEQHLGTPIRRIVRRAVRAGCYQPWIRPVPVLESPGTLSGTTAAGGPKDARLFSTAVRRLLHALISGPGSDGMNRETAANDHLLTCLISGRSR